MKFIKTRLLLIILFAGILLTLGLAVYSQICGKKNIEFQVYKNGIYVVSIDSDYFAKNSDIYVPDSLETVESAAKESTAKVAINAGFFDPNNGKTISYVLKNNQIVENPEQNERLMGSEELKPYFDKILNRSEFRVLKCPIDKILQNGDILSSITRFEIANHNEPLPPQDACTLVYSIQAGPALAPDFDMFKEFFILTAKDNRIIRESASAMQKVARSAIGIKKDRILLVAVSNQTPMNLEELADFMKEIGAEQALAFDGGSSTSLYVDIPEKKFILNSAKDNAARRVKSILIVK